MNKIKQKDQELQQKDQELQQKMDLKDQELQQKDQELQQKMDLKDQELQKIMDLVKTNAPSLAELIEEHKEPDSKRRKK